MSSISLLSGPSPVLGPRAQPGAVRAPREHLGWKGMDRGGMMLLRGREMGQETKFPLQTLPSEQETLPQGCSWGRECCLQFFACQSLQKSSCSRHTPPVLPKSPVRMGGKSTHGYFEEIEQLGLAFRELRCVFLLIHSAITGFSSV